MLFVTIRAGTAYRHLFHAADKLSENRVKACSLSARITVPVAVVRH